MFGIDDNEFDTFDLISVLEEDNNNRSVDDASYLLEGLNEEQSKAVQHLDGPLLILAGAGSGKTRVITYRIAYMMKHYGVQPGSILAITFTNKAANEMKERINQLVGDDSRWIWSGTFHSVFARILRRHAETIGYSSHFAIVDSDDQLKLIKQAMVALSIPEKLYKPKDFQFAISKQKNDMVTAEDYIKYSANDPFSTNVGRIYKLYQNLLLENNSMDFDDILMNMVRLFKDNPDVLEFYRNKFRYIMVDEYQDTNKAQYQAVSLLSGSHKNICVVGDDDQSIYSFRGADVQMILNFEKDFKNATVIKLERNYRSTKNILDAANEVISKNMHRKQKKLRTEGESGSPIIYNITENQSTEADFVANTIKRYVEAGKYQYSDIAILYRMNALSRTVESGLRSRSIPFKVFGGMRFYDRKEIKDVFAYLRLINDSQDNLAFDRIINYPKRGIGDATVDKIKEIALARHTDCLSICGEAHMHPDLSRSSGKLLTFYSLINSFREELKKDQMNFAEFIDYVENKSGIIDEIIMERESKGELIDRVENLKELLSEAVEFENRRRASSDEGDEVAKAEVKADPYLIGETKGDNSLSGLLNAYLVEAALYASSDDDDSTENYVRLMTIHSSKGLEFSVVFIVGLEEGIFPSYKCLNNSNDIEEERRLMYVAITRAKKDLFLIQTRQRMLFGQTQCNATSRFVKDISDCLLYKMGIGLRETTVNTSDRQIGKSKARQEAKKNISSALSSDFVRKPGGTRGSSAIRSSSGGLGPEDLVVGMRVMHERFGIGTILKVELVGGDALLAIDFDGMRKNMLARAAGLTRP